MDVRVAVQDMALDGGGAGLFLGRGEGKGRQLPPRVCRWSTGATEGLLTGGGDPTLGSVKGLVGYVWVNQWGRVCALGSGRTLEGSVRLDRPPSPGAYTSPRVPQPTIPLLGRVSRKPESRSIQAVVGRTVRPCLARAGSPRRRGPVEHESPGPGGDSLLPPPPRDGTFHCWRREALEVSGWSTEAPRGVCPAWHVGPRADLPPLPGSINAPGRQSAILA